MKRREAAMALLGSAACAAGAATRASPPENSRTAPIVGAWRLVKISVQGRSGTRPDPFYGDGVQGVLIYDPSGSMSVQIMSRPRPVLEPPRARPERTSGPNAAAKEAAVDSYYAYYGTWQFDATTETVEHHVEGALYPSEIGAKYRQKARIEGNRLVFEYRSGAPPDEMLQTKIWERVLAPQ